MPKHSPTIQTIDVSDARTALPRLIREIVDHETRILIEEEDAPVAALISMDEQDREAWAILEAMRAPFRGVPAEEIEREAAKANAEARAIRRAARETQAKSA
jgi:antitoxin (DNA-binding transcriptional repressor) of toxin-antitoxin stability system